MLNKHGEGTLYFGVNNNGDIIGKKDINDNTLREILHKIGDGIKPQVIPNKSPGQIERGISSLVNKGYIKHIGSNKNGYYDILK